MRSIGLIATDLDGTLVDEGSPDIDGRYFDAIRTLSGLGIRVAAFTGRHIDSARRLFGPVADLVTYVCDNGAIIGTGDSVIRTFPMPEELYRSVLTECMVLPECRLLATTAGCGYVPADSPDRFVSMLRDRYRFDVQVCEHMEEIKGVIKFSVFNQVNVGDATARVRDHFQESLYSVVAGTNWVDFMMPEVGKGKALRELLAELSMEAEECIAFGDQMNDLEMIQLAGIGCAVSTAVPACKEAADRIVEPWNSCGVLKVLTEIIENGGKL